MIERSHSESELGTWMQCGWRPPAGDPLRACVERIWDFEGTLALGRERLFPNGRLECVIQLDEPHHAADDPTPFPPLAIDGLKTRSETIVGPSGRMRVIGVSLYPAGASLLLRSSLAELTDRTACLGGMVGRGAWELGERLDAASGAVRRIGIIAAWCRARVTAAPPVDAIVLAALRAIERDGGRVALADLDELAGRSRSRFAARFRDAVGLAPKRYARIVRFHHALHRLRTTDESAGRIAADTGYFDQAHFTAEFRTHAGFTPLAYRLAARYPGSEHVIDFGTSEAADGISKTSEAENRMLAS